MAFTKKQIETVTDTNEIVAAYTDVVGFFSGLGITVSDSNQTFTIISRKSNDAGKDQDSLLGEVKSGEKLVIQYTKVTGPTTL